MSNIQNVYNQVSLAEASYADFSTGLVNKGDRFIFPMIEEARDAKEGKSDTEQYSPSYSSAWT